MARTTTGIDVGLRSARALQGQWKGGTFHVSDVAISSVQADAPGEGWSDFELDFKPANARVGLTGRDVNIRYTRVPRVPEWQLRNLMRFEVAEIGDQSGSGLSSDFNLLPELPEVEGEDIVLLAMARESLLEKHVDGIEAAGGKLDSFSPNAIALYNAWLRYGVLQDETVLVADIGHDNVDVVIVRGPDLVFARNLQGGSRLFEEAIAQRFQTSPAKAEELKIDMATLRPGASYADSNQEKASRSILGAAGQMLSLLQSTLLFCKSQLKIPGLKIERVMLCGGGAALDGLPEYLTNGMNVPVEIFDPFRVVQTESLPEEKRELIEEYKLELVTALGLATMASDPDAYSVEVLPEKLRKKREFMAGPAWLVAAGVLGVLYLGFAAINTRQKLETASVQAKKLKGEVSKKERTSRKTADLVAQNADLSELAQLLQATAGSGEQATRVMTALAEDMPNDFWVEKMTSSWSFDDELGVPRDQERPILRLECRAREGTVSLASQYEGFTGALQRGLDGVTMKDSSQISGARFQIDLTTLSPPDPEATSDEPGNDPDGEEGEG
ncbi:MAG: pilus assembly protein PilM [Planctomycetota bacterium]